MTKIQNLSEELAVLKVRHGFTNKHLAEDIFMMDKTDLSRKVNRKAEFTTLEIRTIKRWINELKPINK